MTFVVDLGQGGEEESQINGDLRQEWLITALLAEKDDVPCGSEPLSDVPKCAVINVPIVYLSPD